MSWIDPDYLPQITGTVERFLPTTEGGVDGLLLADGIEVHLPSYMAESVTAVIKPGSLVHIRGLRSRGTSVLHVVAIAPDGGQMILDEGAPEGNDARKAARKTARAAGIAGSTQGSIKKLLHGARGEVSGVLLEDGKVARLPSGDVKTVSDMLTEGATVFLTGSTLTTPYGDLILVRGIGTAEDSMTKLGKSAPGAIRKKARPAAGKKTPAERKAKASGTGKAGAGKLGAGKKAKAAGAVKPKKAGAKLGAGKAGAGKAGAGKVGAGKIAKGKGGGPAAKAKAGAAKAAKTGAGGKRTPAQKVKKQKRLAAKRAAKTA